MSQYKELAWALDTYDEDDKQRDQIAAILRSLDAQPVAWCSLMPNGKIAYFDGRPMVMPGPVGNEHHTTPLYAAPVAAQPTREQAQRERMEARQASRAPSPVTADFDLPAQSDEVAAQPQQAPDMNTEKLKAVALKATPGPVAFRTRYRSEPGMIGHYPWTYAGIERDKNRRPQYDYEFLYSEAYVLALLECVDALRRIADPRNIHFAGDAKVVASAALQKLEAL